MMFSTIYDVISAGTNIVLAATSVGTLVVTYWIYRVMVRTSTVIDKALTIPVNPLAGSSGMPTAKVTGSRVEESPAGVVPPSVDVASASSAQRLDSHDDTVEVHRPPH